MISDELMVVRASDPTKVPVTSIELELALLLLDDVMISGLVLGLGVVSRKVPVISTTNTVNEDQRVILRERR